MPEQRRGRIAGQRASLGQVAEPHYLQSPVHQTERDSATREKLFGLQTCKSAYHEIIVGI